MCGFSGGIYLKNSVNLSKRLEKSSSLLIHRGPDQDGLTIEEQENYIFGLAHRRLSIIDLSEDAIQPMYGDKKETILAYNGEIYNYIELRDELLANGIQFNSKSDTEVVLKSIEYWGIDALKKFNGMFT